MHQGFYEAYRSIRSECHHGIIRALLIHYLDIHPYTASSSYGSNSYDHLRINPKTIELDFCGHSLGGAIACLANYDMKVNLPILWQRVQSQLQHIRLNMSTPKASLGVIQQPYCVLYTFGAPKVGNWQFSRHINKVLTSYYRVEIQDDLITMLPVGLGSYLLYYKHAGTQVLLDSRGMGNMIIHPTVIEKKLWRHSNMPTLSNHSLHQYRNSLEACFPDSAMLAEYLRREVAATSAYKMNSKQVSTTSIQSNHNRRLSEVTIPEWMLRR